MTTITMTRRGSVTIPPGVRRRLGIDTSAQPLFILEERDGGVFLQPATAIPVRDIPAQQIQAWLADDEKGMADFLAKRKKPAR